MPTANTLEPSLAFTAIIATVRKYDNAAEKTGGLMSKALRIFLLGLQGAVCIAPAVRDASAGEAVEQAAPSDSDKLEEIVVTAEKKTENLQKAPVAITVISGLQMVEQGATDIRSIDTLAPGIDIGDERDATQIFIRGIGSQEDTGNTDPAPPVPM